VQHFSRARQDPFGYAEIDAKTEWFASRAHAYVRACTHMSVPTLATSGRPAPLAFAPLDLFLGPPQLSLLVEMRLVAEAHAED
jgi:hypothetical protein